MKTFHRARLGSLLAAGGAPVLLTILLAALATLFLTIGADRLRAGGAGADALVSMLSRATEQELIQFVRAEADDVDGPNLLGRQSGAPKSDPFVLQEPLDLESRSWPIGMGRWPGPTPASHHPLQTDDLQDQAQPIEQIPGSQSLK
jgi:hypothetical protein